jgi:hypothetical protein
LVRAALEAVGAAPEATARHLRYDSIGRSIPGSLHTTREVWRHPDSPARFYVSTTGVRYGRVKVESLDAAPYFDQAMRCRHAPDQLAAAVRLARHLLGLAP